MRRLFGPLSYGASHAFDLAATGLRQTRPRSVGDFVRAVDMFTLRAGLPASEWPRTAKTALGDGKTHLGTQRNNHANRLFVGSLSSDTTDDDLRAAFAVVGQVVNARVIMDSDTGRSKGFGFVEMAAPFTMDDIAPLVDSELGGRRVTVNRAKSMPEHRPRPSRYGEPSAPEIVRPAPEPSAIEEMRPRVDAMFAQVEIVWEGTPRARQSDDAFGSRR